MSTDSSRGEFIDKTVQIKRCAAVVKGGRRFSFAALVVVGDGKGRVGWGYGKANEVPPAVEKGQKQATRHMVTTPLVGAKTIPHLVRARFGSADVMLMPADAGTGVIAGAAGGVEVRGPGGRQGLQELAFHLTTITPPGTQRCRPFQRTTT